MKGIRVYYTASDFKGSLPTPKERGLYLTDSELAELKQQLLREGFEAARENKPLEVWSENEAQMRGHVSNLQAPLYRHKDFAEFLERKGNEL